MDLNQIIGVRNLNGFLPTHGMVTIKKEMEEKNNEVCHFRAFYCETPRKKDQSDLLTKNKKFKS